MTAARRRLAIMRTALALNNGRRLAIGIGLALLGVTLLVGWSAVSAQLPVQIPPLYQASITDNHNLLLPDPTTPCLHSVTSDAECDLSVRLWNKHSSKEKTFTLNEVGVNGAFDGSTITPYQSEYPTYTLGDCPCAYTLPAKGFASFHLRIKVGQLTDGYRTSNIRIYLGAQTTNLRMKEYRLKLVDVTPPPVLTVITVGEVTARKIVLTWTADDRATSYILFWWPKDDIDKATIGATNQKAYTITRLERTTLYVIRVQPVAHGIEFTSADVEVTTTGERPQCPQPTDSDGVIDYDQDDDGLIEICSLTQLNAIRHDLDGDGVVDGDIPHGDFTQAERTANYTAAFPTAKAQMGCNETAATVAERVCHGFELMSDLDFDENENGLRDDTYNTGAGWRPIMARTYSQHGYYLEYGYINSVNQHWFYGMFDSVFEGNGHTIANLYTNYNNEFVGLFGYVTSGGHIQNLGLLSPTVRGRGNVGSLVGFLNQGTISASYARDADVFAWDHNGGGLVGQIWGGTVIESYATGRVYAWRYAGGLAGQIKLYVVAEGQIGQRKAYLLRKVPIGEIRLSFASVDVTGERSRLGGLLGWRRDGTIAGSYATGSVKALGTITGRTSITPIHWSTASVGGFIGHHNHTRLYDGEIRANYTTSQVIGRPAGDRGPGDPTGGYAGSCGPASTYTEYPAMPHAYWDTDIVGPFTSDCARNASNPMKESLLRGYTSAELKAPTNDNAYDVGSIYEYWKVKATADGPMIDPWDFGTSDDYPILDYCSDKPGIDTADGGTHCPLRDYYAQPQVSIAGSDDVSEGETAVFTVNVDQALTTDLDVYVVLSEDGDVSGSADELGLRLATVPAGQTSATLSVSTQADSTSEPPGVISAKLKPTSGFISARTTDGRLDLASVAVLSDDGPPPLSVSLSVVETLLRESHHWGGWTYLDITLSRTLKATEKVVIPITLSGGQQHVQWELWKEDFGVGAVRTEDTHHTTVEFGPGGRVATFRFAGLEDANRLDDVITIAFGTGDRAPMSIGKSAVALSTGGSPVAITLKEHGGRHTNKRDTRPRPR